MSFTLQDELHLTRALTLAQQAAAFANPNPTVGCVLTHNDITIGEGAHYYEARDHAEIAALKQASALGHNVRGATAYVTLEPCSHHGRTGPCSDALIAANIARCIVATVDPNPLISGQGLAKLRAANIEVLILNPAHPLAQQARHLNDAFAHFIQHHRPFVTLKAALSVDGKLAPPPTSRSTNAPHWLTGTAARADAQQLRHTSDAILTGIGTILADNPSLTDRTNLPRRRSLLRVVLDSALRTPLGSALVATASNDLLILCSENTTHAPIEREAALTAAGAEVLCIPTASNHLDLQAALNTLAQRNILSVLVEAGSALNGALLRANLVDRVVLYYAESELGLNALPFAAGYDSPYAVQQRLTQTTRTTFAGLTPNAEDVRITGYLHDPWSTIP
ncbi:MAG: bifunctional diaminohydroxyphosphoribosylaminopyrimidine deaminase/5-amino-6-(5-phosphoribosylamino)uracil reductase RibD [Acidobacteriaceae bacterium]